MRTFLAFAISGILILLNPAASAASATAGSPCSKVGATANIGGKKLICTKVKNKLKWKIARPAKPILAPIFVEILSSNNAKLDGGCSSPAAESFTPSGPLRCVSGKWKLVLETDDSVATRAFRSVFFRYANNALIDVSLELIAQPGIPSEFSYIPSGIRAAARLWSIPNTGARRFPVIMGSDAGWVKATALQRGLVNLQEAWESLERQPKCGQALFVLPELPAEPWFMFCNWLPKERLSSSVGFVQSGAHEYTHLAQRFYLSNLDPTKGGPIPPWVSEGTATYVATALGFAFSANSDLRSLWMSQLAATSTPLSSYQDRMPQVWEDVYPLGMFAAEALVALFGVDVVENLFQLRTRYNDFDETMVRVTGKPFSFWTTTLQGYIESVKAGKPWTLNELQRATA